MKKYRRGDIVWQISPVTGERSKAVFVKFDTKGFPERDCILAIGIGTRGNKITHYFRWPLRLIRPT